MSFLERRTEPGSRGKLWVALLTGPAVFLLNMQIVYLVVTLACETGRPWLHVSALVSAGIVVAAAWVAWRARYTDTERPETEPSLGGHPPPYPEYMLAILGAMTGALFALVIIAQWMSIVIHDPCVQI